MIILLDGEIIKNLPIQKLFRLRDTLELLRPVAVPGDIENAVYIINALIGERADEIRTVITKDET